MKIQYLPILFLSFTSLFADDALRKAENLRKENRLKDAAELLESESVLSPESESLLALLYLDLNWLGKADKIYSQLCEKNPSYECFLAYGTLQMKLGGYEKAAELFIKATKKRNTAASHSNLAVAYLYQRNITSALTHHEKALEISPGDLTVQTNYGVFLFTQNKIDEAEILFKAILHENSGSFYSRLYLGRIYYIRHEYQKSLGELNQGISINPSYFDLYYYRAAAHYKLGNKSSALSDLDRAIRLEPLNSNAVEFRNRVKKERF